jgi:hypothetical protein
MNKRLRNKRKAQLQRAVPYAVTPGGSMYTLPSGANQSVYGQTFYGSMTKNIPTQGDALFSPGVPLYPVKGINPAGLPIQWRFPPQYNTFPASDRSLGNPDIPSFEQLRSLARLFYGIGLCERVWLDLVPRMQLQVKLTKAAVAAGAETKNYQREIAFFQRFFEKPDGKKDYHTWLRMALREQTQIDELYIYKNRKRNGELLGLSLVAGDQMKPLLDQWGHVPDPPEYAYQQYPWGIPGALYSTDMMVHYQESPATDNPYGFSRVERIILIVNLALKKMRKDLAHYASGNVPAGIMEVPEGLNWTPDQIDAYEQRWNSLLAGNAAKQVQVKFTQPGMKYTKLDDFSPDTPFDEFLLNVSVAAYGLSMQDLAFTEDIHKSSGDSQQNVTYRRTVDPLASVYAKVLTECMREDFEPALRGDLLEVCFAGFEEKEDLGTKVAAYAQASGAGLIGLTDAGKALDFPEPPDAPYIGRVIITKDGPIFLDDIATPEARKAAFDAKMTGMQLAANPQQQQGEDDATDTQDASKADSRTQASKMQAGTANNQLPGKKAAQDHDSGGDQERSSGHGSTPHYQSAGGIARTLPAAASEGSTRNVARRDSESREVGQTSADANSTPGNVHAVSPNDRAISAEYRRWRDRALEDMKRGRIQRGFTTTVIPESMHRQMSTDLAACKTVDEVREAFRRAQDAEQPRVSKMGDCDCEVCRERQGKPVGDKAPPYHEGCNCTTEPATMDRAKPGLATSITKLFEDIEQRGNKALMR